MGCIMQRVSAELWYGAFHHATQVAGLTDRRGRGVHVEPRPVHRQHRLSGHQQALRREPRWDRSPGSSAATRSCSPRCSCPPGAGPTRSGASGRSCSAWRSSWRPAAGCAAAPSVGALIVARVVQAAGGALMLPTSLGLMLPEFAPEQRHVAIGLWAASGGIAAAAGPPLGGLLVQADWRLVFLVNVPVGLLALGFGTRILAERRESAPGRPDLVGAATLIIAIGALVVAIVKGQEWGWTSPARARAADRHRGAAARDLVALGPPPHAGGRAGDAAGPQLRARGGGVGAVLRGLRRDAAVGCAVPDRRVARGRADGRPDAVRRPGHGDGLQHALGAARRALRVPAAGDRRGGAVRRSGRCGTSPRPGTRPTTSPSTCRARS